MTDSIAALLNDGHAQAVIELTEYALARLEKAIGNMDDSDGYMSDILPELQNLHHRACLEVRPEPCALARRLFEWEINSDWEFFYGTAETYADVFGAEGLAEYRRLAESEWAKIRQLNPGDKDETSNPPGAFASPASWKRSHDNRATLIRWSKLNAAISRTPGSSNRV